MGLSYNTVGGVISQLHDDGWKELSGTGHARKDQLHVVELTHPKKRGKITIVGPDEQILGPKAIASILIQAGIIPR